MNRTESLIARALTLVIIATWGYVLYRVVTA